MQEEQCVKNVSGIDQPVVEQAVLKIPLLSKMVNGAKPELF